MSVNADRIARPSGTFVPVTAHGPLEPLWVAPASEDGPATAAAGDARPPPPDGLWVVHGTFSMSPAGTFPRTMTVVRHSGGQVAIVNSLRMDEAGEAALRALGNVTAVVRLGSFHGVDDDYYVRMFGAVAYALPGSPLPPALPVPPVALVAGLADAPIPGASVFVFAVTKAEAALHLPAHGPAGSGGTVLFCDAVINMGPRPAHLGWLMAALCRWMGFTGLRPAPLWYKFAKQQGGLDDAYMVAEYRRLLREFPAFGAVVCAHGNVIPTGGHARIEAMAQGLLPPS